MATHNRHMSLLMISAMIVVLVIGLLACQGPGGPSAGPTATPSPTSSSGQLPGRSLAADPAMEGLVSASTQGQGQSGAKAVPTAASTATPASVSPADQAAWGREVFVQNCAKCHGQRGQGFVGPALIGNNSLAGFETAQDLLNFVKTFMPADAPESLKIDDYWSVVAYLVDENDILLPQEVKTLDPDTAPKVTLKR